MDEKFQDRIDNYLLNRMDDAEKTEFLREVEQDEEKKEQLEFTQDVKDSIRSREEKLQALKQFQRQYEQERKTAAYHATGTEQAACYCPAPEVAATEPVRSKKKIWLWISGVAENSPTKAIVVLPSSQCLIMSHLLTIMGHLWSRCVEGMKCSALPQQTVRTTIP